MSSQQYSSELEMANSASLSVYDGDSAYAPKIDPVKESELYLVSTNNESYIDEKMISLNTAPRHMLHFQLLDQNVHIAKMHGLPT